MSRGVANCSERTSGESSEKAHPLKQGEIGYYRKETASIVADARSGWRQGPSAQAEDLLTRTFTLPEAGPREFLCHPLEDRTDLRVGILVSGGIAPGINAVIDGIVSRHNEYRERCTKL